MKLLETKQIRIGEKDYSLKLSVRAMISYTSLSGKNINHVETLQDRINLFYSCMKACNPELQYEAFLDIIDDHPEKIGEFIDLLFDPDEKKAPAQ
jgi:hypothetical protein